MHVEEDDFVDHWRADVKSSHTRDSRKVHGFYNCVPRDLFSDNSDSLMLADDLQWHNIEEDGELDGLLGNFEKVYAIRSLVGAMRGESEVVESERKTSDLEWNYHIESSEGYLGAQYTGFGMHDAHQGRMRLSHGQQGARFEAKEGDHIELIPLNEGVCFFARISGQFDGGGEHIRIMPAGDWWHLRVRSHKDKPVRVTVRCAPYNQETP